MSAGRAAAPAARHPVGVLALQGDWAAHERALAAHGVGAIEVRVAADLDGVAGLVLPGGESTTMLKLMEGTELVPRILELVRRRAPVLATCAGVILLAREVRRPAQACLGALDVAVERNAYGRQLDSTVAALDVVDRAALPGDRIEGVFIRAPRIVACGAGVEVLARRGADPVLVRQDAILAATFHPELSRASPVLDLFVRALENGR
ncbi:MAG TPA: pyridoxal 5'-phosphate synthase glutaminase subunit PdxT [Thermoanaerobaculaceae bacterium]|nr:pyridoxal 5'-phosphate synthase glutaminase subunit PdxT [Thermoanaerobaculaceae bacterium]